MAIGDENPYWRDERRRERIFDVDPATGWQRRFFTIDDLVGVRVEDPEVFEETHRTVLALVAEGADRRAAHRPPRRPRRPGRRTSSACAHAASSGSGSRRSSSRGEQLRDWPVLGTTGYEFASDVTALFVDPAGEAGDDRAVRALHGSRRAATRRCATRPSSSRPAREFAPELAKLRSLYPHPALERRGRLARRVPHLRAARRRAASTTRTARRSRRCPDDLRRVLTLEERGHDEFVVRFQQTTGPVMAKGVEDTALLPLPAAHGAERGRRRSRPLLAPGRGVPPRQRGARRALAALAARLADARHQAQRRRPRAHRRARRASPRNGAELVSGWREVNEPLRRGAGSGRRRGVPDLPDARRRVADRARAPRAPTSRRRCAKPIATPAGARPTRTGSARCSSSRAPSTSTGRSSRPSSRSPSASPRAGERAALGALLLRLTCPGVPDIYQGDELWSLSLVDPDNRRPVDWAQRRRALAALGGRRAAGRARRASST